MPILSAAAEEVVTRTPLDTALTLGLVALLALVVIVAVIRKAVINKKAAEVTVEAAPEAPTPAPLAPGSAGELKLHNVEPKTAAMVMAIVADKLGKPLNELHFISIKEVN